MKTRLTIHLTHYGISPQESQYCISGSLKRNLTAENILKPSRTHTIHAKCIFKRFLAFNGDLLLLTFNHFFFSSVRSSNSHPDLLVIQHPLFQITPVLNTGLSLSEPLQKFQGQSLDSSAGYMYTLCAG